MSKTIKRIFGLLMMMLCICIGSSADSFALSKDDPEYYKAARYALQQCYVGYGVIGNTITTENGGEAYGAKLYSGPDNIFSANSSEVYNTRVFLPTGYYGILTDLGKGVVGEWDASINCRELLSGPDNHSTNTGNTFQGLYSLYGKSVPTSRISTSAVDSFLTGMGYDKKTETVSNNNEHCLTIHYTDSGEAGVSDALCVNVNSDGTIDHTSLNVKSGASREHDPIKIVVSGSDILTMVTFKTSDYASLLGLPIAGAIDSVAFNSETTFNQLTQSVQAVLGSIFADSGYCRNINFTIGGANTVCLSRQSNGSFFTDSSDGSSSSTISIYTMGDKTAASKKAADYIGLGDRNTYSLSEKFILYQDYLADIFNLTALCDQDIIGNQYTLSDANNRGYTEKVRIYTDNGFQECYLNYGSMNQLAKGKTVSGLSGDVFDGTQLTAMDLINSLRNMSGVTSLSDAESSRISKFKLAQINANGEVVATDPGDPDNNIKESQNDDTGSSGTASDNNVCYGADGTLGLGWILCPIATGLYDTLNGVYGIVEENFLKLDGPQLLGSDTYSVWQTFQSIANIAFVIFLLVVIFSQITGFGIDNYGIKKILPRLIICAILINLSFLVVQAAVDVSNIVGVGARGMFSNITPAVNNGATDASGAAVTTAAVVGLGITIGAFVWNPALWTAFLLGLLSCVISVVTLWVILMAREVGVVIIAIIAPVAFACYLLPNTSKWLKSWWNVLKSLLLLYPLAALLVGGSAFVSAIVANTATADAATVGGRISNNLMMLGAMLVRFLPFFMLPTLFRKTLDAVGKLGTTIQGLGRGLSRDVNRRITSSEGYKARQQADQESYNFHRSGIDRRTGDLNWLGRIRSRSVLKTKSGQRLQASRIQSARKAREGEIGASSELGGAVMRYQMARGKGNRDTYLRDQLTKMKENGNSAGIFAAIDQAEKSGMKSTDIAKATRDILGDLTGWGGKLGNEDARGNFLQEFANRYGNSFLKKDAEQKTWTSTRAGKDTSTGVRDLAGFALAGGMETADLKDNEVTDLSADRLYELLSAGIIDRAQAQRVWSSGANMDSINKLMLGALGTRGKLINKADAQTMTARGYSGSLHGLTAQNVQALTEATPQDTVIRDVRWKNEYGEKRQTNPLVTAQDPNVGQFVTFRKDQGNGAANNLSLVQQWDGSLYDPSTGRYFSEDTLRKGGYRRM